MMSHLFDSLTEGGELFLGLIVGGLGENCSTNILLTLAVNT